ncbi:MAG TPA: molybdopterin dinucleotide binding domain-containing protein, partial [Ilumatobacteraceae bacterium]
AGLWPLDVPRPGQATMSMNDVALALGGQLAGWPQSRVLFVQGANPVATAMDQQAMLAGLSREDLFTVVHEQVLTDTAMMADVVLPATTHFEADDVASSYGSFTVLRVDKVIDRVGESRTNDELAAALAAQLGYSADEFDPDPLVMARRMRTDGGSGALPAVRLDGGALQFVDRFPGFADGSTQARLTDITSELVTPTYLPAAAHGLNLITPSTNRTINSMFAEFDPPQAVVAIHPADAHSRGIADGQRVRVFNELGQIELPARVDSSVRTGVVSIPKGLWRRHLDGGLTANALIPRMVNDLGSGACFNDARVEIESCATKGSPVTETEH